MNYNVEKINQKIKIAPLSWSQMQMWIIDRMQQGNYAYNLPVGFRLKGIPDIHALEQSFNEIISRHESLRTSFTLIDDQPSQIIHSELSIKIKVINYESLINRTPEQVAHDEVIKPFDISILPLIRIVLIRKSADDHILLLNLHHIVADGWSLGIICKELSILYKNKTSGESSLLPELHSSYSDYSVSQKNIENSYPEQLKFWRDKLSGSLPQLELPYDKKRPNHLSLKGSNEFFFIDNDFSKKIQSLGLRNGCTFFMTIQAAFQAFLSRYTSSEDVITGTPVTNRPGKNNEILVGNYINILAIRTDFSTKPDFISLLKTIQKNTVDALVNRDYPFEKIVEHLNIKRDPGRNPVFQVMIQVLPKYSFELNGLEVSHFYFDHGYSQFDLSLHMYQTSKGYNCRFEYSTDLFESQTILKMKDNFLYFLDMLIENPESKISDVPLMPPSETDMILNKWNKTEQEYPSTDTIVSLFQNRAAASADNTALIYRNNSLSYVDLNRKANKLASYLITNEVKPGDTIGICMERSEHMVICMLAVLKTGAAYLPLDPSFPADRLKYITEDSGISLLLTEEHLTGLFTDYKRKIIYPISKWKQIENLSNENPGIEIKPGNLAYVIYTSGSSGKPKGVQIEHRSVVNFLSSMQRIPGINQQDVLLAVTTISFDISVLEIFLPLITGAKVIIAGKNDTADGDILLKLIRKFKVSIMEATPATWRLLIESRWQNTPGLKMLCGGEPLPGDLADKMISRGKELWNMYGPTETTVWSSARQIKNSNEIFIGPPIANTQFYVTDNNFQPVPIGIPGELLIGGAGLARGYLNRPDLSKTRFIENPFGNGLLYRTGDLVRYNAYGAIEFIGRTDFQVKIRGYRIELGEIEQVLLEIPEISEAYVVVKERHSEKLLVAYILPVNKSKFKQTEVKKYLRQKLPDYMVPSLFVIVEEFPLTPNGKIDRKSLPEPETTIQDSRIKPSTEYEIKLTAIWERMLGVSGIGIHDNFFDLGGHSLIAARMMTELEKELNCRLPLVTLFEHQSISELALILESGNWKEKWSSLVKIKDGVRSPLILVHGAEGNVLIYRGIAKYLQDGQPLYALQSKGLDGSGEFNMSIEDMASEYIRELKKIFPSGPYHLGGYCMGGIIAHEMAHQLSESGDEVRNVFLLETYNVCSLTAPGSNKMSFRDKIENVLFHFNNLRSLAPSEKIKFIFNKLEIEKRRFISHIKAFLKYFGIKVPDSKESFSANSRLREINDNAQLIYRPKTYHGRTILLKPKINYSSAPDPNFGWKGFFKGDFKIYKLNVAPRGMLYEPFAKDTAAVLTRELEEAFEKRENNPVLTY